jgi:hypothetical protein
VSPIRRTSFADFYDLHRRGVVLAFVAAMLVLVGIALVTALVVTSAPAFLGGFHSLSQSYDTLQSSAHKNIPCDKCHADPRGDFVYRALLVVDLYRGLFSKPKQPLVTVAKPTREACLSCHRDDWSMEATRTTKVPHPAHLRVITETRDCVQCHRWVAHEETYEQKHTAMPFSSVCASFGCHVGWKQSTDCATCHHSLQGTSAEWRKAHPQTVKTSGANSCLETCHTADQCRECHTTGKTPTFSAGGVQTAVSTLEKEHVKSDWLSKHGTFALADQSKCLVCHVSEAECQDCHSRRPAFHGPQSTWLVRHKDFAKPASNPQRCLTCHQQSWCDACHKQFKEMR